MNNSSDFMLQSLRLLRERGLLLLASALLCAVAAALLASLLTPLYRSTAVLTLTDWQAERLARRDAPTDNNPANVGGAAADEMSRALVQLKSADLWAALQAKPEQLSFEHKRRGNVLELRMTSEQAGQATELLQQLVQLWDQRLQQAFIAQREQQLQQVADTQMAVELQQAKLLSPFALRFLQAPSPAGLPLSRPWFYWALFSGAAAFVLLFQLMLFRRLFVCKA